VTAFLLAFAVAVLLGGASSWIGERFVLGTIPPLACRAGWSSQQARVLAVLSRVQWHVAISGFVATLMLGAALAFLGWQAPQPLWFASFAAFSAGAPALGVWPALRLSQGAKPSWKRALFCWTLLLAVVAAAFYFAGH
jgi:hypothetical protein